MNSALQCLSSTEPLRDVFLKEEYHTYINVVIYKFLYKLFLHSQQHLKWCDNVLEATNLVLLLYLGRASILLGSHLGP